MTGRRGSSLIERLFASLAEAVIGLIQAVLFIGGQARKEIAADNAAGGMFSKPKPKPGTRNAGRGATTGPGRGRGGPMGAEPKGTKPAGEDRDDWDRGKGDYWDGRSRGSGSEFGDELDRPESAEHNAFDGLDGDDRSPDERAEDLRAEGYDGDIDADGNSMDDSWDGMDVPTPDREGASL